MSKAFPNIIKLLEYLESEIQEIEKFVNRKPPVRASVCKYLVRGSEYFQQIANNKGEIELAPANQQIFLYRGQNQLYGNCDSSLKRRHQADDEEAFVSILKSIEFEIVLRKHPAVRHLLQKKFNIDFLGLAQHYGLPTNRIDFTSDPWIAAFFATTYYDEKIECFKPATSEQGEIYQTRLIDYFNPNGKHEFHTIGLLPFERPVFQKAYGLTPSGGVSGKRLVFDQDTKFSQMILDKFNGGDMLFPPDPIVEKAQEIKKLRDFSLSAFLLLMDRHLRFQNTNKYIKDNSITLHENSPHNFSKSELHNLKESWENSGKEIFYSRMLPPQFVYKA